MSKLKDEAKNQTNSLRSVLNLNQINLINSEILSYPYLLKLYL